MINKFFETLFDSREVTCVGSLFKNQIVDPKTLPGEMFYALNALHHGVDHGYKEKSTYDFKTPRRCDINVVKFRNFLFEMDTITLKDQLKILRGCDVPWTAIVYSGGKSFHAILSLDEPLGGCHTRPGIEAYKVVWSRLSLKIEHFAKELGFSNVVDQSVKNPSRFTRYPDSVRVRKDKSLKRQTLISLGARISSNDFKNLLDSCPKIFKSVSKAANRLDVSNMEDFFNKAPQVLVHELKYPIGCQASGEYCRVFRLSCWLRDLGVEEELANVLLWYKLFPKLLEVGYGEHKIELGFRHSYKK